jgi:hypothetical protein
MNDLPKDKNRHDVNRLNRTGEDIDMLNESKSEPESDERSGSYRYKDNYDGA